MEEFTGTSRHPSTFKPSSCAISSIREIGAAEAKNAIPAAYDPTFGKSKSVTARKNKSGILIRIPAPSPLSGSAPEAPRCSKLRRAVKPCATISWVAFPVKVATMATPQESRSFSGLYNPEAGGKFENLLFMLAIKFAPFLFVFLDC